MANEFDFGFTAVDEDELEIAIAKFKNQYQKSSIASLDFEPDSEGREIPAKLAIPEYC